MPDRLRVVVAAAGTGSRMGTATNKQYLLLHGKPVLSYCLDFFESLAVVDQVVVVCRADEQDYCQREIIAPFGYRKVAAVLAGGAERQDSVWNGLSSLPSDTGLVAVHDGARPLLSRSMFDRILGAAQQWGAAVPGISPKDTLKSVDGDNFVRLTLDRGSIVAVQTPQIFRFTDLRQAYRQAQEEGFRGTDDASLFERYIGRVKVVEGDYGNLKITTPEDLALAEVLLQSPPVVRKEGD